jgi:hypothetical protein
LEHFVLQGWREGRAYSNFLYSFIDPVFYSEHYPELGFGPGRYGEAVSHWMYYGAFENRIPNSVTQMLADADIYLFQMGKVASKAIEAAILLPSHS